MTLIETQARQHEQMYSDEHRKLLGAHYTPDAIVDYIVRRALGPFLQSPDTLATVRILDPACGSGLFLLKAYEILADRWRKTFGSFSPKDARHIVENSLFGIDIDEQAVLATRRHLLEKASLSQPDSGIIDKGIVVGDALSLGPPSTFIPIQNQTSDGLFPGNLFSKHTFDCIVGNPPYVRIQNTPLEKRGRYTSSYTTAAGRFDVSALFLELSEHLLKQDGRVGFIISNKILSTAGAKRIRAFLLTHFSIEEIVDLTDTKLFDAAVLPMILIATRSRQNGNRIAYSSITESHTVTADSIQTENILRFLDDSDIPFEGNVCAQNRVFQIQRFYVNPPSLRTKVWTFHNERQNRILLKLQQNSACKLSDLSRKISVGLKTTADTVFIKPMSKEFIRQKGLEADLLFPVLESHNLRRWTCSWDQERDLFVLYPHIEQDGKVMPVELDAYPRIKEYLEASRAQLEARAYLADAGRRWYEIWVHQSPSDFSRKKIVTPDISSSNRFAFDGKGFYVNGTCFYIILADESDDSYYSILGLLNSRVIEYFHKITSGNSLYAKRFRYWSSYIGEYPVAKRLFDSPELRSSIIRNVSRLHDTNDETERIELEKENDLLCYRLFDLTEDEVKEIESTLSACSPRSPKKGNLRK